MKRLLLVAWWWGLMGIAIPSYALTLDWDRNPDTDGVKDYHVYLCETTGCTVQLSPAQLVGTVVQSASGVRPSFILPNGKEGRVAVTARDQANNESGLSVSVPFDSLAPSIPKNPTVR